MSNQKNRWDKNLTSLWQHPYCEHRFLPWDLRRTRITQQLGLWTLLWSGNSDYLSQNITRSIQRAPFPAMRLTKIYSNWKSKMAAKKAHCDHLTIFWLVNISECIYTNENVVLHTIVWINLCSYTFHLSITIKRKTWSKVSITILSVGLK